MSRLVCAKQSAILLFILFSMSVVSASAQTTIFTYQGRFVDSTLPQPTNGNYEMQYKLFDTGAVGAGNQVGITQTVSSVSVVNGIFTVRLDFGGGVFRGTNVFIETSVRPSGSANPFTVLAPRQQITFAPLAIRSLNANLAELADNSLALGGIPADQFVLTNDLRLFDDRNPNPFSANYIQNQNANSQAANFYINGTGAANIFNAATQFNIGGNRVLSVGGGNIFAGVNAGTATTTGIDNAFFGTNAGMVNIAGFNNAFFGMDAGRNNTAANNSFFGRSAGFDNTTGGNNSFFGLDAGRFNTTGGNNAFFGMNAGSTNTQGSDNAFFGLNSGFSNTIGSQNTFVGRNSGVNNTSGSTNSFFGINSGITNTVGGNNSAFGNQADFAANNLFFATAIGAGSVVSTSNTIVLGRSDGSDTVRIFGLGAAGNTPLCRNASNQISTCVAVGGGGNFIDNSTVLQPTSNFNISGNGTVGGNLSANIVNSTTNFRIGSTVVLSTPNATSVVVGQSSNHTLSGSNSTFLGYKAGQISNSFSQANTFIGSESGESNTSGGNNSFVGKDAGFFNASGSFNSFFGSSAGKTNSTADANSFFGYESGLVNSTGTRNSFFGFQTGKTNGTVNDNSFFGYQAGNATTVSGNSFFGSQAGSSNNNGAANAFFGDSSGGANIGGSNNAFFGSNSGSSNTSGIENSFFGSGAGGDNSIGNGNSVFGFQAGSLGGNAAFNTVIGYKAGNSNFGNNNTFLGANSNTFGAASNHSTAIGADSFFTESNVIVLGTNLDTVQVPNNLKVFGNALIGDMFASGNVDIQGNLHLLNLSSGGMTQVCRNASANLSVCSSSLRYKTNIASYFGGLNLLNQLKPITFNWKDGGMHDLGFGAEDVEKVDPLLVTYNESGQVEGVKYDRISAILVNSVKEQQTQIAQQAEQIRQQQIQIEALKETVCAMNPAAKLCN